jgi:hypothetical protein
MIMKKVKFTLFLLLAVVFSAMAQNTISITGLGEIPYIKNENKFSLELKDYGKFDFTGTIQPLSLSTEVSIDQLTKFPGYKTMSNLSLDSILLEISTEGFSVIAKADTKKKLGPLFEALKISAPTIEIETKIGKGTFEMEGELAFPEPIEMFHIANPGTVFKYSSLKLGTSAEAGSLNLQVTIGLTIKPSDVDPDLATSFTMGYNLITQEITGSGAYSTQWIDPFGINTYVKENSIILNGGALEIGWVVATPTPSKIGIAIKDATLFGKEFATYITIAPAEKQIGLYASRADKMTGNDMFMILRDGFGLDIPNIFPDCYSLTNSVIQFAPTDIEVDTFKMRKGFELSGFAEVCDLYTGNFEYYFDMEDQFIIHADFAVDAKKFLMNEARKVDVLASAVDRIFEDVEIKSLYIDMGGSLSDMKMAGTTKVVMRVMNQDYPLEFEATLDPEVLAQKIFNELKNKAPGVFTAVAEISNKVKSIAGPAVGASINIAQQGFNKIGHYGKVVAEYRHHFRHDNCMGECVPNRANSLTGPTLEASNNAVLEFYHRVHDELQHLVGLTPQQTVDLRHQLIGSEWKRLMNDLDSKWRGIIDDQHYHGYDKDPDDVRRLGYEYRRLVNIKYHEHRNYRKALWKRLLTHGNGSFHIQNRWKPEQYIHQNWDKLQSATIKQEWPNAQWEFEPVIGTEYFKIKNTGKGTYINIEHGKLESGEIAPGWHSAQWKVERVPGTQFVRIRNRWKGTYLNNETGAITSSEIGPGAHSSMWDLAPLLSSVNWHSTGDWLPVETNTLLRIKNRHKGGYIQIESGPVHSTPVSHGWQSAQWIIEPSNDPYYMRIKNRWKGTYLNVENGKLEASAIKPGAHSAMWEIISVPGTQYFKIRNRWKSDWYIHHEWDILECATIQQGWHSAMWEFDYQINPAPITVSYNQAEGCGTFYRNGVELKKHCGWRKSWHTALMLGNTANSWTDYKILLYDQTAGSGEIYKVDDKGNMQLLKGHSGWGNNWSKITWEPRDGNNGLIKFELPNGYFEKYTCDDNGNIGLHSKKQ